MTPNVALERDEIYCTCITVFLLLSVWIINAVLHVVVVVKAPSKVPRMTESTSAPAVAVVEPQAQERTVESIRQKYLQSRTLSFIFFTNKTLIWTATCDQQLRKASVQ